MKLDLKHVEMRKSQYPFFVKRVGAAKICEALPLPLFSREFWESYRHKLRQHAPKVFHALHGAGRDRGTLAWIIGQFTTDDAQPWSTLSPATRAKYRLRLEWLAKHYGEFVMAAISEDDVVDIRNKLRAEPSVANETIDRIGQLWRWAKENCALRGDDKLGTDPTREIKHIEIETDSAKVWPEELCAKFETCGNAELITFYFLARYTGQRRGDCLKMRWSDILSDGKIAVTQEKTGTKIKVPCHPRLAAHLATCARKGELILPSSRTGRELSGPTTSTRVTEICVALGFSGYSPHGLRHAAAKGLIQAGCTPDMVMAITGHKNRSQLDRYLQELEQETLAEQAMAKWVAADEQRASAAVAVASNVTPLRARTRGI